MRLKTKLFSTALALAALAATSGCGNDHHRNYTSLSQDHAIEKINKENEKKK